MINESNLKKMFEESAILIGNADVVPLYKAKEIFGDNIISKVKNNNSDRYWNGYGNGDFTVLYITYDGFKYAATLQNMNEIYKIENNLYNRVESQIYPSCIGGASV